MGRFFFLTPPARFKPRIGCVCKRFKSRHGRQHCAIGTKRGLPPKVEIHRIGPTHYGVGGGTRKKRKEKGNAPLRLPLHCWYYGCDGSKKVAPTCSSNQLGWTLWDTADISTWQGPPGPQGCLLVHQSLKGAQGGAGGPLVGATGARLVLKGEYWSPSSPWSTKGSPSVPIGPKVPKRAGTVLQAPLVLPGNELVPKVSTGSPKVFQGRFGNGPRLEQQCPPRGWPPVQGSNHTGFRCHAIGK